MAIIEHGGETPNIANSRLKGISKSLRPFKGYYNRTSLRSLDRGNALRKVGLSALNKNLLG